jgi:hypothetical protein
VVPREVQTMDCSKCKVQAASYLAASFYFISIHS